MSARKTDLAVGGESSQWRSCPTFACCVVGRGVGARASLRGPPISTSDRTSSPLRSSTAWPLFNEKKICEVPVAAISLSLTAARSRRSAAASFRCCYRSGQFLTCSGVEAAQLPSESAYGKFRIKSEWEIAPLKRSSVVSSSEKTILFSSSCQPPLHRFRF